LSFDGALLRSNQPACVTPPIRSKYEHLRISFGFIQSSCPSHPSRISHPELPMALVNAARRMTCISAVIIGAVNAQTQTYYYSGAIEVWTSYAPQGTPAAEAQCPEDYPLRCSSIGASEYCCPSENECSWNNGQVVCCPEGEECYEEEDQWETTSEWQQPTTTYWQPTSQWEQTTTEWQQTTEWEPTTTTEWQHTSEWEQTTTTEPYYTNQEYCSTLVETGPNLPTTAEAGCGTILIVTPSRATREVVGWIRVGLTVLLFQALGGWMLLRR